MDEWQFHALEDTAAARVVEVGGRGRATGRPRPAAAAAGGDIFDLALGGQTATIEAIEQDYDGRVHLAVVVDADPGRDFGMLRQPGHRFFFCGRRGGAVAMNGARVRRATADGTGRRYRQHVPRRRRVRRRGRATAGGSRVPARA